MKKNESIQKWIKQNVIIFRIPNQKIGFQGTAEVMTMRKRKTKQKQQMTRSRMRIRQRKK